MNLRLKQMAILGVVTALSASLPALAQSNIGNGVSKGSNQIRQNETATSQV